MQWVGQSYLFQFYIQGNFDRKIWETFNSLDQPTLAKFSYGAWLYPSYFSEKKLRGGKFDYTKYLISNGYYFVDADLSEYRLYRESLKQKVPEIKSEDTGFREDYLKKYGEKINNTLNIIFYARNINFVYLALAVLILTFFLSGQKGFFFSFLIVLLYGFNTLIVRNGVKAHSDALFLLLFNTALVLLFYYFLKKNMTYLILFSLFSGLAMSTKLNGIMLYFIFILLYLSEYFPSFWGGAKQRLQNLRDLIIPILIPLAVFIILNPYTYSNPLQKIRQMYDFRKKHTIHLSQYYPEVSLTTAGSTLIQIPKNFFSYKYFAGYNLPIFIKPVKYLGTLMLIFFLCGIYSEFLLFVKGNKFSYLIFSSFIYILLIMSFYLRLNWDRYFMHLVFFFIYYQVSGITFILDFIKTFVNRHSDLTRIVEK